MSSRSHAWISEVLVDIVAFAKLNGLSHLAADLIEILQSHAEIRAHGRPCDADVISASVWTNLDGEVVTTIRERCQAVTPLGGVLRHETTIQSAAGLLR